MNKLKKRILSILVAAVMCVGVLPAAAFAEEPASEPKVVDVDATLLYSSDEKQEQNQEQPAPVAEEDENDPAPVAEEGETDPAAAAEGETDTQSSEVPAFPVDGTEEEQQKWYQENVDRPTQTPGLDTSTGTDTDIPAQPAETPEDQNWSVFWNEKTQRYELTYEIDEEAEGDQTIDLTKALDLLNQYADTASKTERDEKIAEAEQAAQEEANAEQKPEEPVSSFDQTEPEEPGKIEDLDTKLDTAYGDIISNVPRDPEGEPQESYDYAGVIAEKTGLTKDDPYVKEMASYMYDQAMVDWVMDNWDTWEANGHDYANYFGDPDTMLYYGCGITVKWPDGTNQGTPVLKDSKPVYEIDKESDTYKAYLQAKQDYEEALAAWENSEEGQAYKTACGAYEADLAAYNAKLAEIAARLENAKEAIRNEYTQRLNANVLQPGDIRKFDIYITSKSGHTYKYKDGSFTLTTPDLTGRGDPETGIPGFDGQIIPGGDNGYLDRVEYTYNVTTALKPIADLFRAQATTDEQYWEIERELKGHKNFEDVIAYLANNTKISATTIDEVAKALGATYTRTEGASGYDRVSYNFDDLAGAVSNYLVKYYSEKDGKTYADLADVFAHSTTARTDMTSSENTTQSDKNFTIGGDNLSTTYGKDFTYNSFYQSLISFVYGDQAKVDEMLGGIAGIQQTSKHPEFVNGNWSSDFEGKGLDLDYSVVLEQYMSHQKAWDQANAYFKQLLSKGVSVENATAAAFTMAVNIDGELTSNNWQLTKWGWNNSLQLEQMDYDFNLTKVDENGNPITNDRTGFQLWYMKVTVDDNGNEVSQKMFCTRVEGEDAEGNPTYTYTFDTTESTIYTENGELNITNAMLKDIVYYLQEVQAPTGYELENTVYVIVDEKAVANADWDALEEEAGVTLVRDENGQPVSLIQVATDANGVPYVNQEIQIVNIANPGDDPEDPDNGDPDPDPDPDPEPPTTPIEDPEVPLTETPIEEIEDPEVPLTEEPFEELEDPEVPLAEVPMTGDSPLVMMIATFAALTSAAWLFLLRKREHNA